VLKTVATTGAGVAELLAAIGQFRAHSGGVQAARRRTRSEYRLRELVSHRFMDHLEREVLATDELRAMVDRIAARELDPYTAANDLLGRALQSPARSAQLPEPLPDHPITKLSNP
jgi:LAO/AO transport system kinase